MRLLNRVGKEVSARAGRAAGTNVFPRFIRKQHLTAAGHSNGNSANQLHYWLYEKKYSFSTCGRISLPHSSKPFNNSKSFSPCPIFEEFLSSTSLQAPYIFMRMEQYTT